MEILLKLERKMNGFGLLPNWTCPSYPDFNFNFRGGTVLGECLEEFGVAVLELGGGGVDSWDRSLGRGGGGVVSRLGRERALTCGGPKGMKSLVRERRGLDDRIVVLRRGSLGFR